MSAFQDPCTDNNFSYERTHARLNELSSDRHTCLFLLFTRPFTISPNTIRSTRERMSRTHICIPLTHTRTPTSKTTEKKERSDQGYLMNILYRRRLKRWQIKYTYFAYDRERWMVINVRKWERFMLRSEGKKITVFSLPLSLSLGVSLCRAVLLSGDTREWV